MYYRDDENMISESPCLKIQKMNKKEKKRKISNRLNKYTYTLYRSIPSWLINLWSLRKIPCRENFSKNSILFFRIIRIYPNYILTNLLINEKKRRKKRTLMLLLYTAHHCSSRRTTYHFYQNFFIPVYTHTSGKTRNLLETCLITFISRPSWLLVWHGWKINRS